MITVPPGTQIGRYRLLGKIGSGASGAVYRAQDPTIGRVIALKLLDAEPIATSADSSGGGWQAERFFKREAEAAGALTHPNIVTLYDAGYHEPFFYLAMELVDGETIASEIARAGCLSEARTIDVGTAVADALHYAHFRGVVHRDIKPANLICRHDGTVKVSDFGIARLVGLAGSQASGHMFVGTPAYASPEAIQGEALDGRSDQFSLGIVLYLAATGRHPFPASGIPATIYAILSQDPVDPQSIAHELSPALSRIILRALRRDPNERFADCRELADALRAIGRGVGSDHTVRLTPQAPQRPVRWGRFALGLALATIAAVGGGIAQRLLRNADPPDSNRAIAIQPLNDTVTLGVVPFKGIAGESPNGWVRDALRDALNTELSQLSRVRVYSKEFLDFLVERKRLTEIEAMNELGIKKMLSGSVWSNEDQLHAEAFITNVSSGILEGSVSADGTMHDFAGLRSQLVMRVIERLQLPISAEERTALEARQRVPVDPLRLLLEAEGGPGSSPAESARDPGPISQVWRAILLAFGWPPSAHAADDVPTEAERAAREPILATLERYRRAAQEGDVGTLRTVFTEFRPDQQEAIQRYLSVTKDLQITISDVELRVVGDDAVVSYTRVDEFVDRLTGRPARMAIRLTKTLRYDSSGWRINPRSETH